MLDKINRSLAITILLTLPIGVDLTQSKSALAVELPRLPRNHILQTTRGCAGLDRLLYVETKNYIVYICGGRDDEGNPVSYEGYAKNPRKGYVKLSLFHYRWIGDSGRYHFEADNGRTHYYVDSSVLVVSRGSRTIVREKVRRWCQFPDGNNDC